MKTARIFITILSAFVLSLSFTASAWANAGKVVGQGWIAEANDLIVTAFGLGLVVFFTLLVTVLSIIQAKRKKAGH